jgi:putative protease
LDKTGNSLNAGRYLLSPKDICALGILNRFAEAGIRSLKIEGRMKSPEYVAVVTRIYRKYLDSLKRAGDGTINAQQVNPEDMKSLMQIFNRGAFSDAYLNGKKGRDMMCWDKPKNHGVRIGLVISQRAYDNSIEVKLEDMLSIGDGIEVWNGDDESPGAIVSSIMVRGQNVKSAPAASVVVVGTVKGSSLKGCMVYKTSDKALNTEARESYTGKSLKRIKLSGEAILQKGKPFLFKAADEDGNHAEAEGILLPEAAVNVPMSEERLRDQLSKTGATPFSFKDISISLDEGLTLPISEINDVRRRVLARLEELRGTKYDRRLQSHQINYDKDSSAVKADRKKTKLALYLYKINDDIDYAYLGAERIYLPFRSLLDDSGRSIADKCRKAGVEVFAWLPGITRGSYDRLLKKPDEGDILKHVDGILAGNTGSIGLLSESTGSVDLISDNTGLVKKNHEMKVMGDHHLNVFNTKAVGTALKLGYDGVTLSPELTLGQTIEIAKRRKSGAEGDTAELEAIVYGRLALMTSEYCAPGCVSGGLSSDTKCKGSCSKGAFRLKDRMGVEFPVICDNLSCRSTILNSNNLFVPDITSRLADSGIDILRLYIHEETASEIKTIMSIYRDYLELGAGAGTVHQKEIDTIKALGFTKGHYFRGV